MFLHSVLEFPAAFHSCFPLTFAFVSLSGFGPPMTSASGPTSHVQTEEACDGSFESWLLWLFFPLACPVLASFSTSFSTYALPFQILCLNGTRFLPNWHKFLWLIAATYMFDMFSSLLAFVGLRTPLALPSRWSDLLDYAMPICIRIADSTEVAITTSAATRFARPVTQKDLHERNGRKKRHRTGENNSRLMGVASTHT